MFINYINTVKLIDNNFFTLKECNQLIDTLFALKSYWQNTDAINFLTFLPLPKYIIPDRIEYIQNVHLYKELMYANFSVIYEKLRDVLSNLFEIKCSFHENLNYPGFHITTGKEMKYHNFHIDHFPSLSSFLINEEKLYFANYHIFSIIIPLSTISDSDGLIFENKTKPYGPYNFLRYTPGMLAIWDGNIKHSIKPFLSHSDKLRITLQCHLIMKGNKGLIYW
jgi:hypothetical protein